MTTAIVLMCDRAFLAPTIGTALQARANVTDPSVSVRIFVTDCEAPMLTEPARRLSARGIGLDAFHIAALTSIRAQDFNTTHVPVSTMARLWIDDILPSDCDRFLYLDGDLEIASSLDPLLSQKIPHRGFLAAPDLPYLIAGDGGKTARNTEAYLQGLRLTGPRQYFNAGVILADRRGWRSIADAAWEYFKDNPKRCQYHDQSALNATAQALRGELSLRWNYQTDFMAAADPCRWNMPPAIYHFTGFPKPWHACAFPWDARFGETCRVGRRLLDASGFELPPPADEQRIRDAVLGRHKLQHRLNWVYPWRRHKRARRIKQHLTETWGTPAVLHKNGDRASAPLAAEQMAS